MLYRMILIVFAVILLTPVTSLADSSNTKLKTITRKELRVKRPAFFYSMMVSKDPVCQEILNELNKPYRPNWDELNKIGQHQSNNLAAKWLGSSKSIMWTKIQVDQSDTPSLFHAKFDSDGNGKAENYYLFSWGLAGSDDQLMQKSDIDLPDFISMNQYAEVMQQSSKDIIAGLPRGKMFGKAGVVDVMQLNGKYYALSTMTSEIKSEDHFVFVTQITKKTNPSEGICKFKDQYKIRN